MSAVRVTLVATLLIFSIILEHSNGLEVNVNVAIKPQKGISSHEGDLVVPKTPRKYALTIILLKDGLRSK